MKDDLDKAIANTAYVLDALMLLRRILQSGSCHKCEYRTDCRYLPRPGQLARYNCPHFEWGEEDSQQD